MGEGDRFGGGTTGETESCGDGGCGGGGVGRGATTRFVLTLGTGTGSGGGATSRWRVVPEVGGVNRGGGRPAFFGGDVVAAAKSVPIVASSAIVASSELRCSFEFAEIDLE